MDETSKKFAYTIDELVDLGCRSRSFLYEKIGAGRLKATKRGARTVVLNPHLKAWLASLPATAIRSRSTPRRATRREGARR